MWGGDFSLSALLAQIVVVVAIVAICIGFGIKFGYDSITQKEGIESSHRIEPIIKLTIKNNKVDTIYVYKKTLK
jgi:hypothetical protein